MEFEYETPRVLSTHEGGITGKVFFSRLDAALATIAEDYDVVAIDCPPQLGYLTMAALCTATAVLIPVHPQMLDVMSMCQFLLMLGDVLAHLKSAGGNMRYDWLRYLITRHEPSDSPQTQMVGIHALALRATRPDPSDAQKRRNIGCQHHQADALRGRAAAIHSCDL